MTLLTDDEEKAFLAWVNAGALRARQIAEVGRASGRLELSRLLETGVGQANNGLPAGLTKDRAVIQSAKMRARALEGLGHFARSAKFSLRNLIRLHRKLREVRP